MIDGHLIINGQPVKRRAAAAGVIPIDANSPCGSTPTRAMTSGGRAPTGSDLPGAGRPRDAARRAQLRHHRSRPRDGDDFGPMRVPAGHVWLMGDNRDRSAPTAGFPTGRGGLGGPVPFENIGGRAEFITFSPRRHDQLVNPSSWFSASARAGPGHRCGAADGVSIGQAAAGTARSTARRAARTGRVPRSAGAPRNAQRAAVWIGMVLLVAGVIFLAQPLLLIIGGLIFAVLLDGGARLLGRVLPIGRGWRLADRHPRRFRLPRLGLLFRRDHHRRPGRGPARGGRPPSSTG